MSKPVEPFNISIQNKNSDKIYSICVWLSTTVLDIKVFFHTKSGYEINNIKLYYDDKQLKDILTVGMIGIKKGDYIIMNSLDEISRGLSIF